MTWQNVSLLVALVALVLLAPKLGADAQTVGVVTTLISGVLVERKVSAANPPAA